MTAAMTFAQAKTIKNNKVCNSLLSMDSCLCRSRRLELIKI